jgi:hypothetical protein
MENDWTKGTELKSAPFWRDGMSPEEYEEEREYWKKNIAQWKKGEYIPLWKQKEK